MLMADPRTVTATMKKLTCHGCKREFDVRGAWGQHVSSCAVAPGGHATKRHNAVVNIVRRGLAAAGLQPDASEPRDLAMYLCGCGLTLAHTVFIEHRKTCQNSRKTPLHISGPDLRYIADGITTVADVTIISPLTASHAHQTLEEAFDAARATKMASYGEMCAAAGVKLVAFPAASNGPLGRELIAIGNIIADRTFRSRHTVRAEMSAAAAHGSGVARLAAEEAIGIRPPTIALNQVRLLEQFTHVPLAHAPAEPAVCPAGLPPLLPTPQVAAATFEQCIALGVNRAIRDSLPELAVGWVAALRAAAAEEERVRRAASAPRETAPESEPEPEPAAGARADHDATVPEEFRERVVAQTERDLVERHALANLADAEAASERQRAALREATAALQRETDARVHQCAVDEAQANRRVATAGAQSKSLQRAASEATARAAADVRALDALAEELESAREAAADRIARAHESAAHANEIADAMQQRMFLAQRVTADALAAAEVSREKSEARALVLAEQTDTDIAQLTGDRLAAQLVEQQAMLARRRVLSHEHRDTMSQMRAASSASRSELEPAPDIGAQTTLRPADAHRASSVSSTPIARAPSPHVQAAPQPVDNSATGRRSVRPEASTPADRASLRPESSTPRYDARTELRPADETRWLGAQTPAAQAPVYRTPAARRDDDGGPTVRSPALSMRVPQPTAPAAQVQRRSSVAPVHNEAAFLGPPAPDSDGGVTDNRPSANPASTPAGPRNGRTQVSWLTNTPSSGSPQAVNTSAPAAAAAPREKSASPQSRTADSPRRARSPAQARDESEV
jgi:hypothetical protein